MGLLKELLTIATEPDNVNFSEMLFKYSIEYLVKVEGFVLFPNSYILNPNLIVNVSQAS